MSFSSVFIPEMQLRGLVQNLDACKIQIEEQHSEIIEKNKLIKEKDEKLKEKDEKIVHLQTEVTYYKIKSTNLEDDIERLRRAIKNMVIFFRKENKAEFKQLCDRFKIILEKSTFDESDKKKEQPQFKKSDEIFFDLFCNLFCIATVYYKCHKNVESSDITAIQKKEYITKIKKWESTYCSSDGVKNPKDFLEGIRIFTEHIDCTFFEKNKLESDPLNRIEQSVIESTKTRCIIL